MSRLSEWFVNNWQAVVTSLLSVTAIVVSIVAFMKSHRTQRRLVEIEEARERDRLAERQKATLVARFHREPPTMGRRDLLEIENTGLAAAREVTVLLEGKPILNHPVVVSPRKEITKIGPKSQIQYVLNLPSGGSRSYDVHVAWKDDSGEQREYDTTLTL
jgi:hypothetical protein